MKIDIIIIALLFILILSCKNQHVDLTGNYTTEEYKKRNEGWDWVVVTVNKISDTTIHIIVRSRVDKKSASCSLEGVGMLIEDGVYKVHDGNNNLYFKFSKNKITVSGDDDKTPRWYCSGGASLADFTFSKLDDPLDETQLFSSKAQETKQEVTDQTPLIEVINPDATADDRLKELETLPSDGSYLKEVYEGNGEETNKIVMVFSNKSSIAYMYIFTKNGNIYKEQLDNIRADLGLKYMSEHYLVLKKANSIQVTNVGGTYFTGSKVK